MARRSHPTTVEWTVDSTPPDATTEDTTCGAVEPGTGAAALYAGCGENLDRSIVRPVTVPAAGGTLSFQALWDTEEGWDFGFVQISTDGGKTWKSLATEDTTTSTTPVPCSNVVAELPGFTGDSGEWKTENADLSAYAGKKVLIGFRYITDPGVNESGFWVRDIHVGGTTLPSDSLDGWKTITQVVPVAVPDWTVQLVGIADNKVTWIPQASRSTSPSTARSRAGPPEGRWAGRRRPPWRHSSRWTTRASRSRSTASTS